MNPLQRPWLDDDERAADDLIRPQNQDSGVHDKNNVDKRKTHVEPTRVEVDAQDSDSEASDSRSAETDSTESESSRRQISAVHRGFNYLRYKLKSLLLRFSRERKSMPRRENAMRTITIVYYSSTDAKDNSRTVRAIFDTGCRRNLISRRTADALGFVVRENEKKVKIRGLGGGEITSEGTLEGRWVLECNSCTIFGYKIRDMMTFAHASFEVCSEDWFEVIIGLRTIRTLSRTPGVPFAAPSRRLAPSKGMHFARV